MEGYPVHARYVERFDPRVTLVFDGLEPEPVDISLTRTGNYYNPTSTKTSSLNTGTDLGLKPEHFKENGTAKENSFMLYDWLVYLRRDVPVTSIQYPSVNSSQQYKSFNTFSLAASDIENTEKTITGSVEEGWTVTYKRAAEEDPVNPPQDPTDTNDKLDKSKVVGSEIVDGTPRTGDSNYLKLYVFSGLMSLALIAFAVVKKLRRN